MIDYRYIQRLSAEVRARKRRERIDRFAREYDQDRCLKRAAWKAGVAERTAREYRKAIEGR